MLQLPYEQRYQNHNLYHNYFSQLILFYQRQQNVPEIEYPDLPVTAEKRAIAEAIENHQVVIIAGETGSGKTTQIPKKE